MSRAATAVVDYLPELEEAQRSPLEKSSAFRLLGLSEERTVARNTENYRQRTISAMQAQEPSRELTLVRRENFAPYQEAPRHRRPLASWRWALAIGVGVAVAISILTPVLAAHGNGLHSLRISGYADVAQGVISNDTLVPVIDTTSAAPQPVDPPQPAAQIVQPAAASADGYMLMRGPSISVNQIESVLTQYGSPAVGFGQTIYDLGVKYGIDPAYALAFFVHESGCGTKGVARFTKSIGNIRWTEGYDNYEGYRSYSSWASGVEDWYKLIKELYIDGWHLQTVDAIVPVYAPYGDNNNPPGYIAAVKSMVDRWRGK